MKSNIVGKYLKTNIYIVFLGLISSVILARVLGPEKRGEVLAIQVWPGFLTLIGSFGLTQTVIYYESSKRVNTDILWVNTWFVSLAQSILLVPVGLAVLYLIYPNSTAEFKQGYCWILTIIPLSVFSQYCISILQANHLATKVNRLRLIIPIGYSLFIFVAYFFHITIFLVVIIQVALNLIVTAYSIIYVRQYLKSVGLNHYRFSGYSWKLIKELHGYGLKIWLGDISQNLNVRSDQIFVASMLSPLQMGFYAVSVSISSLTFSVVNAFKSFLLPEISSITSPAEQQQSFEKNFQKYWDINFILSAVLALATIIGIPILYGESYRPAIIIAIVLVAGSVFANAKSLIISALQGIGRPLIGSIVELVGFVLIGILIKLWSVKMGALGATLSLLIVGLLQFVFLMYYVNAYVFKLKIYKLLAFGYIYSLYKKAFK